MTFGDSRCLIDTTVEQGVSFRNSANVHHSHVGDQTPAQQAVEALGQ